MSDEKDEKLESEAVEPDANEAPERPKRRLRRKKDDGKHAAAAEQAKAEEAGGEDEPAGADAPDAGDAEEPTAGEAVPEEGATDEDAGDDEDVAPEEGATDEDAGDEEEAAAEEPAAGQKRGRRRRGSAETTTTAKRETVPAPRDPSGRVAIRAQAKYVRCAPRKARLVVDHIRGRSVEDARAILNTTPRAAARDVLKLLDSAIANAENNHELLADELKVGKVFVDEGPTLKRFQPRAQGRATRIRKRTSHMTILLTTKEDI